MICPFPPQVSGGSMASYHFYRNLTTFFNHKIEVLSYQKFQNKCVKAKGVALRGDESPIRGILFLIFGFFKGLILYSKFKPDLIYSKHLMSPSIVAYLISKVVRVPLISHTAGPDIQSIEFMSSNVPSRFSTLYLNLFSYLRLRVLKHSSVIVCNCTADFIALQEIYKNKKSIVIYNGLDTNKFKFRADSRKKIREKYNIKQNESVVIYTGQANKQKQTHILLKLAEENSKFKFLIVGPTVDELLNFGKINKNVIVTGPIYGNIDEYLAAADIFILPSKQEGLSNSLLEALSVNLPVIITPVGEAKHIIIHKENGILSSVTKFSIWLNKLVENTNLRNIIKKNSRKTIEINFNWERNSKRLSDVFEIVKKHKNAERETLI